MKRAAVMSGALVMVMAFGALASTSFVGITAPLREQMAMVNSDELIRVNLVMTNHLDPGYLSERAAGMSKVERRRFVLDELKRFSESSQREVRGYLEKMEASGHVDNIQIIWMANAINFEATPAVIERLARLKGVRSIDWDEPFPLETLLDLPEKTPHRVGAGDQYLWNLERIRAPEVWDLGFTGQGVVIGNIDTGTDYNHPDLADHIWINEGEIPNNGIDDDNNGYIDDWRGWDFVNNDNDPMDQSGHGTSTAGIAAGDGTGGTQTGVAPDAEIMILLSGGEGPAWAAVQYAADNGADVVTSSQSYKFGYHQPDYGMFRQMAEYELAAGVIHSNSIGNQGGDPAHPIPWNISTPGNCPPPWLHPDQTLIGGLSSTLGCGATDINDIIKSYSGRGPAAWEDIQAYYPSYPHPMPPEYWDYPYDNGNQMGLLKPDVSAPTDVTTTQLGGGYTSGFSGTSAATPHLGGSLCLMLSAAPSATPAMLCEAIQMTALDLGAPGKDNLYGAGRIDVYEAVQALMVGAVSLQLAPGTSSVPQGGTFEIEVTATNNTGEVQVFDAWADVVLPNSNPYGPVAGPRTVTLGPNQTRVRTVTQRIPSTAPLGAYTYCGKIGTYPDDVMDQDCFDIEVTP
ncbi:hypothetical protein AMJ39_08360 [candidate division TA06 bacterium DG_24]|uniref:Peptidase S8/S53 domain-containing protein n=3 Tax=Bacteria division TA06 TaxID=1156500 RepID=A0A0S8JIT9_UNCT6|nr:MAG: hypothetical protein AMJ39_08360 [candidate division TA06 bacterium DG_24]KPK70451.1 MAG: hypothetical protein AMJ82_03255 [candidate division TA06 bacterium SM23_40]KPL08491.1 MAG: hypothetical protein AMJ71_08265 [candidate division TA06 bacterium SM1_40]